MRNTAAAIALACVFSTPIAVHATEPAPLYTTAATIALGAPERWDYVVFDTDSGRVYVAHGAQVDVVDPVKRTVVGTISPFPGGTHGIGIVTATHTGYTDDGKTGTAVPFDLSTLATTAAIATAPDADGIVFDPASNHILVINGNSGSVTAIDPKTNKALATIAGGGGLEFGVVDGKGEFFVDGAEHNELVRINTATNAVDAHWPLAGCERPHGIALDGTSRRLFVSCANAVLVVVDADAGKEIASFPIGKFNDGAVFDPVRKRVLAANGDGTLSVIVEQGPDSFQPLGTVSTPLSARTIAIDPKTGRVFLVAADIAKIEPAATPGGRPHVEFVPNSLRLIMLDPAR